MKSPHSPLFSRLNKPSSSSLSLQEALHPSDYPPGPPLGPLQKHHILSVQGPRPGCNIPDGASWGYGRKEQSLHSCCLHTSSDAAQDTLGVPGCKWALLAHRQQPRQENEIQDARKWDDGEQAVGLLFLIHFVLKLAIRHTKQQEQGKKKKRKKKVKERIRAIL